MWEMAHPKLNCMHWRRLVLSPDVQARVAAAGAIRLLVSMLVREAGGEAMEAACAALATLAKANSDIQAASASAGAVPLLVALLDAAKERIRENAARALPSPSKARSRCVGLHERWTPLDRPPLIDPP